MKKVKSNTKWWTAIIVVSFLTLISLIIAGIAGVFMAGSLDIGNVALIKVSGPIMVGDSTGVFGASVTSSTDVVEFIEKAQEDDSVKAIIFEINSPGGSAVASEEIANAIKKCDKPTVSWIREVGASGGYWVASSTDHIIASKMSITGSIGVIGSYLDFSGLINKYNVSYERLVAGEHKDIGIPFRELTEDERDLMQDLLDEIHDIFIEEVAENRGLDTEDVEDLATGMIYLGGEAKKLGLIDQIGSKEEVINYLEEEIEITVDIIEYQKEKTFADLLRGVFAPRKISMGSIDTIPKI